MLERLKSFTDMFFVRSRIIALSAFIVLFLVFSAIYAAIFSAQNEDPVEGSEVKDNIHTELEVLPQKAPYAESFTGYDAEAVVLFRNEYEKTAANRTYNENLKITTASGIVTAVSGGTTEAVFPTLSESGDKALFISSAVKLRADTVHLELPDTLSAILSENSRLIDAGGAFSESTRLESVYLPKGLRYIGNKAFFGCNLLSDICIPYLTSYIGDEAFAYCTSLSEIGVYGNTAIGDNAFTGCSALSEVYLSNRVTRVGISAFENTPFFDSLTEEFAVVGDILIKYNGDGGDVKIPEGVRIIGDGVFAGRISIKSVQLPESLEYIGNSAFRSCARLEKVTFAQGDEVLPEIGENAFDGCAKLDFESLDAIGKLTVNSRREFYFEDTAKDILKTKIKRFNALDICDFPGSVPDTTFL